MQKVEGEKDPEGKSVGVLERDAYLTSFLLPEDGRWGVSFGLTLERHIFSRSCCLVLGLSHKLWWDWEGESDKETGTVQNWLNRAGIHLLLKSAWLCLLSPSRSVLSDLPTPHALTFLPILLQHHPSSPQQAIPGGALTVNTEGARCLHAAHTVLCYTGVSTLVFSTHSVDPKAVVTPYLIPAPLPTPSWVGHSYRPLPSPPGQTTGSGEAGQDSKGTGDGTHCVK